MDKNRKLIKCGKTSKGDDCKLCKKKGELCHLHIKTVTKSPKSKVKSPKSMDVSDYSEEQFEELTRGKTLLLVSGCFCPPHAGHYGLIKSAIAKIRPDIVVIQSTNNEEEKYSRHGTPLSHTLRTWKEWAKIFSRQYGVYVYVASIYDNILWKSDPKVLIELDVTEGGDFPATYINNPMESVNFENKSSAYFTKMHKGKNNYFLYHIKRKGKISATKFTKCLKDLTKDCIKYVPEDINNRAEYVKNIRERYGKLLK